MMGVREPSLEPGLLRVFRIATGLRLGILVLMALTLRATSPGPRPPSLPALSGIAEALLLLVWLLLPGLARRLGRAYLPITLVLASALPILSRQAGLAASLGPRGRLSPFSIVPPEMLMALLVPAVIAAWQYGVRAVIGIAAGTAALESGLLLARLPGLPGGLVLTLMLVRTGVLVLVGYAVFYLVAVQRERREALVQANIQLARHAAVAERLATTAERNRLARELHDTLAHTLSGLAVQLEAMRSLWETDPARTRAMLDQALGTARTGLTEARRALHDLRASPLEDLGLPLAVRSLAESVGARTGAAVTLQIPDAGARFPPEVEQAAYRVAQEALENIARHTDARHITVALHEERSSLLLTIRDDGLGFDPGASNAASGLGLKGVRERAQMLGGTIEIDSRPGGPTALRLSLPIST